MTLGDGIRSIERYMRSKDTRPRFINIQNIGDLLRVRTHFEVGNNLFLSAARFSANDELPNFDSVLDTIAQYEGPVFLVEFTTAAKLLGRDSLRQLVTELAHYSKKNCRTVIICHQCEDELAFHDARLQEIVYCIDGEPDRRPQIILIPEDMSAPPNVQPVNGIHQITSRLESTEVIEPLYVRTRKGKSSFPNSLLSITELNDAFDILCLRDPRTRALRKEYGTSQQWVKALNEVTQRGSWLQVVNEKFGNTSNMESAMAGWSLMSATTQWYYFIALKLFGAKNNQCLHLAAIKAESPDQLIKESYRCLLSLENTENEYWNLYEQRKTLLEIIGKSEQEAYDYCALAMSKGLDAITYFTDGSKVEREYILKYLDKYGMELGKKKILEVLEKVYPDLFIYLQPFRFEQNTLSEYFSNYTYAKVVNKVIPELVDMMEYQSVAREYNMLLCPRSELMHYIPKSNVTLYYMDALGAEFVSFINEKCYQLGLRPSIKVARCNLPSITSVNKDFLEGFDDEDIVTIKEIDDIKHQGIQNYDYRNTKEPLHLVRELEIINEILERIKQRLLINPGRRVFIVSDHGATRMAVIMENTLSIDVNAKGTHGGRVCEFTEEIALIPHAAEADGYYVLANYDKFKGGRKASVEAHGGATLEEVTVPVIEIALVPPNMEIIILTPTIQVSIRKKAEIRLFSKTLLNDVTIDVNGKHYHADTADQHNFIIEMPDLRRVDRYTFDVYSENNLVWRGLKFTVEKEGFKEIDLL